MIESCGVVWRPRNLQNMYCIWVADTQFSIIKNRAKVVDSGVLEGTPLSATTAFFLNGGGVGNLILCGRERGMGRWCY